MSEIKSINIPKWTGEYSVNTEKLGDKRISFPQNKLNRKINLKLDKADVQVLDLMADFFNVPKSVIINDILYRILLDEFNEIKDLDTKYLIAIAADLGKEYPPYGSSWVDTFMGRSEYMSSISLGFASKNYCLGPDAIPHSESFNKIKARLRNFHSYEQSDDTNQNTNENEG